VRVRGSDGWFAHALVALRARRRIFFMEGLLLGPGQTRALMAGLKKLEGASSQHACATARSDACTGEQGIKITLDAAVPV